MPPTTNIPARFQLRRFGRDTDAALRVDNSEPVTTEWLRSEILAAGERCKRARAKGWVDARQETLESTPEQIRDQGLDEEP